MHSPPVWVRASSTIDRATSDKQCLQVGVRHAKIAPHWVSIDLYDTSPLIDHNYDVQDMPFEDESFDFVVCCAILEHVPYPERAIAEIFRVLRPGGEVAIEVPLNQPFHAAPSDYWRVTPEGLRIWMRDFETESIGVFSIEGSPFYNGVFYHGRRPRR